MRRGPWALSLLAALALHAATIVLVAATPGAEPPSGGPAGGTPLLVRWIAAGAASAEAVAASHAGSPARNDSQAPSVSLKADVPTAAMASPAAPAAAVEAAATAHEASVEATHAASVLATGNGVGLALAMPDVAMAEPVTVLRLVLSVDADGRVDTLEVLDADARVELVDAVRDALVGRMLPGAGPSTAATPRWNLELHFVEGEPLARWRLWRAS